MLTTKSGRGDKPSSSQVPNPLALTNVVEQESSSEDKQSDENESEDEEINEQTNIVESKAFNILLGGSYTHLPIREVTIKEEKNEPILNVDDSGKFKGIQYSRKNNDGSPTTYKETNKNESFPK